MSFTRFTVFALAVTLLATGCQKTPAKSENANNQLEKINTLTVKGTVLAIEFANTEETRRQGLSGRKELAENNGMLFDFRNTGQTRPGFWMKDMQFDLDMIWIQDSRVVEITKNVPKPNPGTVLSNLPTYAPSTNIDMVLEVNAGWTDRHAIKTGDAIQLNLE